MARARAAAPVSDKERRMERLKGQIMKLQELACRAALEAVVGLAELLLASLRLIQSRS